MFGRQRSVTIECKHCLAQHTVPVEYEGAGDRDAEYIVGHVDFETWRCEADDCTERCCENCRAVCFSCDGSFCSDHVTKVGKHYFCPICAPGALEEEASALQVNRAGVAGVAVNVVEHTTRIS